MNRPKTIAKSRKRAQGFMTTEPESNQKPIHDQTASGFDSNLITNLFQTCDRSNPTFTAVLVAASAGVTDAAVGKARKALKQVLPEEIIFNKKFTELGKVLIEQYFQRPESLSGAAWIHQLRQVVGALPSTSVSSPAADPKSFWAGVSQDRQAETTALALRSSSLLSQLQELNNYDEIGDDDAFEAELARRQELAYEREIRLELAAAQGRAKARQDVRRG